MPNHRFDDLRSAETRLAEMSPEDRALALQGVDLAPLIWSWSYRGRKDQLAICDDPAHQVLFVGGRGTGKTRTGSEWVRDKIRKSDRPLRIALVGRTAADVRDVMINGSSGLMNVFPPSEKPDYKPSNRRLEFNDGSFAITFSAEEPSQLRGPEFDVTWADEIAAWDLRPDDSGTNAYDNAVFATRHGSKPQILATTTPKRIQFLRDLMKQAEEKQRVSLYNQASTLDNPHLDENYLEVIQEIYGGTGLSLQEIYGQMLDAAEGALWNEKGLDEHRTYDHPGTLPIRILGVDPTVAENPKDECGIVLIGASPKAAPPQKRTAYVMGDFSIQGPPSEWVPVVAKMSKEYRAVVRAESNQGGELVRDAIHSFDPSVPVQLVNAMQSKQLRAEPVAMAFQQGRVKMFRRYAELEEQMMSWVPGETAKSPDRIDALVHALAGVVTVAKTKGLSGGTTRVSNPGRRRL